MFAKSNYGDFLETNIHSLISISIHEYGSVTELSNGTIQNIKIF